MGGYAWVTLATNDSYSLGALVLAHSLKNAGTAHQLVVIITPAVSAPMREQLQTVFDVVQSVDVLDSKDEAHLALLKRPELGVTFTKIHCWRLTQFDKCVFLDADTLVVRNCDELFDRDEFSAAPDVGWPDCFNSGVFVFKPSEETFKKLVDFASEKGSFDGGDQGLLNLFFNSWATDDYTKRLPFVYNLTSVAVYSYLPAFKQFGSETRIVHFIGPVKPWLQPIDPSTRTVQPTPDTAHLQPLLQHWWNVFAEKVHPGLSTSLEYGLGLLPSSEATSACTHEPPPSDTNYALCDLVPAPSFPEPYTPYIEHDDCRQYNLPYQPFQVVSKDGELLNITFADVVRENDQLNADFCENGNDTPVDHSESEKHKENGDEEPENNSTQEESSFEDQPNEPQCEPQVEYSPFDYNQFVPDEACINAYLTQNFETFQAENHYHSQPVEEPPPLPRFLTIPEDDQRQSFINYSESRDYDATFNQEPSIFVEHQSPPDVNHSQPPPVTSQERAQQPIAKSNSMSNLIFNVADTQSFPTMTQWSSQPNVTEPEPPKKFTLPGLKHFKPKVYTPSTVTMPKYTESTEFHMVTNYKDPLGPPVDNVGFIERDIINKSKSKSSIVLQQPQPSPKIHAVPTFLHPDNEYVDIAECKRQAGNKPKPADAGNEALEVPNSSKLRRRFKKVTRRPADKWKPPEQPATNNVDEILEKLSNFALNHTQLQTLPNELPGHNSFTRSRPSPVNHVSTPAAHKKFSKKQVLPNFFGPDSFDAKLDSSIAPQTSNASNENDVKINIQNSKPKRKRSRRSISKFGPIIFDSDEEFSPIFEDLPKICVSVATPLTGVIIFPDSVTPTREMNRTFVVNKSSGDPPSSQDNVNHIDVAKSDKETVDTITSSKPHTDIQPTVETASKVRIGSDSALPPIETDSICHSITNELSALRIDDGGNSADSCTGPVVKESMNVEVDNETHDEELSRNEFNADHYTNDNHNVNGSSDESAALHNDGTSENLSEKSVSAREASERSNKLPHIERGMSNGVSDSVCQLKLNSDKAAAVTTTKQLGMGSNLSPGTAEIYSTLEETSHNDDGLCTFECKENHSPVSSDSPASQKLISEIAQLVVEPKDPATNLESQRVRLLNEYINFDDSIEETSHNENGFCTYVSKDITSVLRQKHNAQPKDESAGSKINGQLTDIIEDISKPSVKVSAEMKTADSLLNETFDVEASSSLTRGEEMNLIPSLDFSLTKENEEPTLTAHEPLKESFDGDSSERKSSNSEIESKETANLESHDQLNNEDALKSSNIDTTADSNVQEGRNAIADPSMKSGIVISETTLPLMSEVPAESTASNDQISTDVSSVAVNDAVSTPSYAFVVASKGAPSSTCIENIPSSSIVWRHVGRVQKEQRSDVKDKPNISETRKNPVRSEADKPRPQTSRGSPRLIKSSKRKAENIEAAVPANRYEILKLEEPVRKLSPRSKKLKKASKPSSKSKAFPQLTTSCISVSETERQQDDRNDGELQQLDNSGIAGAIAQLSLDNQTSPPGSEASAAQTDYIRRQSWETGNMDYMGKDSFANIWSKINESMTHSSIAENPASPTSSNPTQ